MHVFGLLRLRTTNSWRGRKPFEFPLLQMGIIWQLILAVIECLITVTINIMIDITITQTKNAMSIASANNRQPIAKYELAFSRPQNAMSSAKAISNASSSSSIARIARAFHLVH